VNRGKFAPAERGRPEATVWRILSALKKGLRLRASDAASAVHPPPRRRDTYRKILLMKTTLKLKINMSREYQELIIYPYKPSTGLRNLVRLSL
jgi:hypothetical protein